MLLFYNTVVNHDVFCVFNVIHIIQHFWLPERPLVQFRLDNWGFTANLFPHTMHIFYS
jgi:hypothetical protein